MTVFLDADDLLHIAERAIGAPPELRDAGLLASAAARVQASAFGADAYPTLDEKAAALMHSLARNHPLVDGNKRLALAAVLIFLAVNGEPLTLTEDEAYDLTIAVATGELQEIPTLAIALRAGLPG
ncbi:MAG: type II toxin-antitoxin system death-on-curing family toxin [Solirubrobacteraceae bacterium]|nr:type II toxin-antitoxin system death-on-curing family toxin [Solirubrobacteraceae bacterium]